MRDGDDGDVGYGEGEEDDEEVVGDEVEGLEDQVFHRASILLCFNKKSRLTIPDSEHIIAHKAVEGFCGLGIKSSVAALLSSSFASLENLAIVLGLHLEYSMVDFL